MGRIDDPSPVGSLPPSKEMADQLDLVRIPQIDARYSMGGGAVIGDEVKAEPMMFSRAWIRQFTEAPISDLFWTEGDGDSMMPTIGPRDVLLGDRSQNQPVKSDQIWALTQYGHGMIKRLRATAEGYTILSDNPSVPPDTATDGSMHIIGRIVAVVRRL
ncbi:MAG: S24 family peptidase [Asticcacaulis sp.]